MDISNDEIKRILSYIIYMRRHVHPEMISQLQKLSNALFTTDNLNTIENLVLKSCVIDAIEICSKMITKSLNEKRNEQ